MTGGADNPIHKTKEKTAFPFEGCKVTYILSKKGLDPVVVHKEVGLLLNVLVQGLIQLRVHVADDWDLDRLELDLLLATPHGLDYLGAALVASDTVCDVVKVDRGSEGTGAIILGTALALVAGVGGRMTDLVTGLAVEEAVVAALSVDGGSTGKADGAVSLELEYLHRHARRI